MFNETPANKMHVGKARAGIEKNMKRIHLDKIMKGFVAGLEKWEASVARKLQKLAWFRSLNNDGILMGIEFSDDNLLRDGWGPWFMIKSHTQKTDSVPGSVRHRSFKRGTTPKSSVPS